MASTTNVGVKDSGKTSKITYDIPPSLLNGVCSFYLRPEGDQEVGVFELRMNGELVKVNISSPFDSGTFKILKQEKCERNKCYVVKVSKPKDVDCCNFFS